MAKPNYSFEKRQRDLEKKKKQEEKRLKKLDRKVEPDGSSPDANAGSDAAGPSNPESGSAS